MKKLYIIGEGEGVYYLINEDGYFMASHYCSEAGYAKGDLLERRKERKEERKHYLKDGYELIFATKDEEVMLKELNSKFADEEYEKKYYNSIISGVNVSLTN